MVGRRGWVRVTQPSCLPPTTAFGLACTRGRFRVDEVDSFDLHQLHGEAELVNHACASDELAPEGAVGVRAHANEVETKSNTGEADSKADPDASASGDDDGRLEVGRGREPSYMLTALATVCAQVEQVINVPHDVVEAWLVRPFNYLLSPAAY